MKTLGVHNCCFLLFLLVTLPALSDDRQKAEKVLSQITAMATDTNGRRAVSLAVADTLSVSRAELARRRHAMNLNYGELFVAYALVKNGMKFLDVATEIQSGKTIWQIANDQRLDWKSVISDAKKLNSRIDDNLIQHFTNRQADARSNQADAYNPFLDGVKADSKVSKDEILAAHDRYNFLREHVHVTSDQRLDTSAEQAARTARPDPIDNAGPGADTRPGPN